MKSRTNIYRNIGVHTKPLNGVSIPKNVSCGSFYNTEAEKSTTLMNFHIFSLHAERALHIKKKSNQQMSAYVRLTCRT